MKRWAFLQLGVTSTAVLTLVGGAVAWLHPGLRGCAMSPIGREVFAVVSRAVPDRSLPQADGPRQTALNGLLGRSDSLMQALPPPVQAELSQLLPLLGSTAGRRTLAGLSPAWTDASIAEIQQALQGMRWSALDLRQHAYAALHDIAMGGYFADAATWPMLGYPGTLKI